ncbi:MAG: hypothetical protein JNK48_17345 [Bryobacterales bacterium]|nr:hypothetical protein [Bryobacterales bacterium]
MRVLLALATFAAALSAADLSGIWVGQYPGRNNEPIDIAFQFQHKGDALSGKLYGDFKSMRIVEGKIAGDQVQFVVIAEEQAGNQINETRLRFTGTLKDGEIELTRERESSRNAGNGGEVQSRNNTKLTFRLKRL